MGKSNKLFWLHPFLAALYFPLSLYSSNTSETDLGVLLWTLGLCLTVAGVFYGIMTLALKRSDRVPLCLTAYITLFFVYGYLFTAIQRWLVYSWIMQLDTTLHPRFIHIVSLSLHITLTLIYLVIAISLWRWAAKASTGNPHVNRAVMLAAVYLIVTASLSAAWDIHRSSGDAPSSHVNTPQINASAADLQSQIRPDIYYIILDGYSRDDVLKQFYKHDNAEFIGFLEKAGFYVPRHSYSNYGHTLPSLSSSLNMKYHDEREFDVQRLGHKAVDKKYFDLIRNNEVMSHFKSYGYQIVNLSSTWSATMVMPQADVQYKYNGGLFKTEFDKALFGMSLFKALDVWFRQDLANWHRYNFTQLPLLAQIKSPKLVFAHFVIPHSPYVFDRYGNSLKDIRMENMWDTNNNNFTSAYGYRDQLVFTTQMIAKAIAQILSTSKTPPIILVQADHGMNLVVNGPAALASKVKHAIFTSYYFPDRDYSRLYDSISPVNSFRTVLNQYFGEDLPLLPDTVQD